MRKLIVLVLGIVTTVTILTILTIFQSSAMATDQVYQPDVYQPEIYQSRPDPYEVRRQERFFQERRNYESEEKATQHWNEQMRDVNNGTSHRKNRNY